VLGIPRQGSMRGGGAVDGSPKSDGACRARSSGAGVATLGVAGGEAPQGK
jgi:hypothetical protein